MVVVILGVLALHYKVVFFFKYMFEVSAVSSFDPSQYEVTGPSQPLRRASSRPWSTVAPPCQLTRRCSRTSGCMVSER